MNKSKQLREQTLTFWNLIHKNNKNLLFVIGEEQFIADHKPSKGDVYMSMSYLEKTVKQLDELPIEKQSQTKSASTKSAETVTYVYADWKELYKDEIKELLAQNRKAILEEVRSVLPKEIENRYGMISPDVGYKQAIKEMRQKLSTLEGKQND
jgi:RecG-like helicase